MPHPDNKNSKEDKLIEQLDKFVKCHLEYNKDRTRTSTEKELLKKASKFAESYPHLNLERREETNYRTFCAHGTNAWALFSASAFSNGQLLAKNEIKLKGMIPLSGETRGDSTENRNFVSTIDLTDRSASLTVPIGYSKFSTISPEGGYSFLRTEPCDYLKDKLLKKDENRNNSRVKQDFQTIFESPSMQAACNKLCEIPIIVIGDGVGDSGFTFSKLSFIDSSEFETSEIRYKRVNTRAVGVSEIDKEFVQSLIKTINPELEKTIVFLTTEAIEKFEKEREVQDVDQPYIIDFLRTFEKLRVRVKIDYSIMEPEPLRIEEDIIYKAFRSHLKIKEAGEIVYYEPSLEKTPLQVIDEIGRRALQASSEVIKGVNTLAEKNAEIDCIAGYFKQYYRFWNRELDFYQYTYEASDNNLIDKIKKIRIVIHLAEDYLAVRPIIEKYRKTLYVENKDASLERVHWLEIIEHSVSVFDKIFVMNERRFARYEQLLKEELNSLGERKFISGLMSIYEGYAKNCLNNINLLSGWELLKRKQFKKEYPDVISSLAKITNEDISKNGRGVDCYGKDAGKDLKIFKENSFAESNQFFHSVIESIRQLILYFENYDKVNPHQYLFLKKKGHVETLISKFSKYRDNLIFNKEIPNSSQSKLVSLSEVVQSWRKWVGSEDKNLQKLDLEVFKISMKP